MSSSSELFDSDSDSFIIDEDAEKPELDKLIIKNTSKGYIVEKGKKQKKNSANKMIRPFTQSAFYMVPALKNRPLSQEELAHIYKKCSEENCCINDSSSSLEESNVSNFVDQDPLVDSTGTENISFENQCTSNFVEGCFKNNISNQDSLLNDSADFFYSPNHLMDTQDISTIQEDNVFEEETVLEKEDRFFKEETLGAIMNSSPLDPIVLSRSFSGEYYVKKDCFLGEKLRNISELQELSNSKLEKKVFYSYMQLEEPILEKLFSTVSDVSEASAVNEDFNENVIFEENEVMADGSLLVVNRSISDVITVVNN